MKTKRFFSVLSAFAIFLAALTFPVAAGENVRVVLNETELSFDVLPQIMDGRTLVPLRTVFESLGCDVYWSGEFEVIIVVKNDIKLVMQIGFADFYKFTGNDFDWFIQQMSEGNFVDVEKYQFDIPPQIVDNRTLVPIRFLCEAMGVTVSWDDRNKTVILTCDNDFILDENTDKSFADQAFIFFQDLVDGNIHYEENPTDTEYSLKYEDTNIDILAELNIISEADLNKDSYITNLKALEILHKACAYDEIDLEERAYELSEWYRGNTLEPLDYLDDYDKMLLLDLLGFGGRNPVITCDDILNMEFDDAITNCEALKYVIRMIGDTYSCTDTTEEIGFTDKAQIYKTAYRKGIIDNIDLESSDLPIHSKDFYKMIHKAIFVEMNIGGYAPSKGRYVEFILEKNKRASQPKEEVVIHTHKISVEPVFHDDMSISWTLPDDYKYFTEEGYWTDISTVTSDGIIENCMTGTATDSQINTARVIQLMARAYPEKLNYIRCSYYKYERGAQTRDEWFFDIDITNITMLIEGDEIKPGTYTRFKRQWVPESISLADGQMFKENAYYLLTSYDHTYRNPKYNAVSRAIFKMSETSNIFDNASGHSNLGVGGVYLEEIRIQEIIIKGTAESGFTLCVTPLSKEIFTVVEGSAGAY